MNFFTTDPSGSMPMGNNFNNPSNFRGMAMPPGGSFMDMINGPPMMSPINQQSMPRFNPSMYSSMYSPSPFGMESSASRLQQFARQQVTPRPNSYPLSGQSMQEQMAMYNNMQQMTRIRMKQAAMPGFNSQRYGSPMSPWARMPPSMPHLQQQQAPQRNPMDMIQGMNSDPVRISNLQPLSTPQPPPGPPYRKMPVLEEAPPSLRGQTQQTANLNSQQFIDRMFSNPPSNSVASPSYSHQQSNPSLNLNSSDALNLPNMNFPSPQRAPSQPGQFSSNFLNSFNNDLNNIPSSVPQSPKLTHFGPSPASSVTSFEQLTPSSNAQKTGTPVTQTPPYGAQTSNQVIAGSPASMNYLPMSPPTTTKPKSHPPTNNSSLQGQPKFHSFFLQMQHIQQQLNQLRQTPQTPQTVNQIQLLNQEYQIIF